MHGAGRVKFYGETFRSFFGFYYLEADYTPEIFPKFTEKQLRWWFVLANNNAFEHYFDFSRLRLDGDLP